MSATTSTPIVCSNGTASLNYQRWQFDAIASNYLDAQRLKDALKGLLNDYRGTLAEGTVISSSILKMELDSPMEEGRGGYAFRSVIEYEFGYDPMGLGFSNVLTEADIEGLVADLAALHAADTTEAAARIAGDAALATEIADIPAGGGLNIATAGSANIPSPLYVPGETPASTAPFIFVQDVNGDWHTQAVIDTATANDAPAGILTWVRPMYFRDGLVATQAGKNAFLSANHTMGAGVKSNNQDRTLWASQGNASSPLSSFSIDGSNNVTFVLFASPYPWCPGQLIYGNGLTAGTYLNGVVLTVTSAALSGGLWTVVASSETFAHAAVASTTDTGNADQQIYGGAVIQLEMDAQGTPIINGSPDGELRTLSLQFADTTVGAALPQVGVGCIRAQYFREAGAGSWSEGAGPDNVRLIFSNLSSVASTQTLVNLNLLANDDGPSTGLTYVATQINAPATAFSFNYGLLIPSWPTAAGSYALYVGGGVSYFGGTAILNSSLIDSTGSAGSSGQALSSTGSVTKWANNASKLLTTAGDIFYEDSSPAPARLPIGAGGDVLTVVGGLPAWASSSGSGSPTTTGSGGFWGQTFFFPSAATPNSGNVSANNKIRLKLFCIPVATTCTGLAIDITSAVSSSTVTMDVGLFTLTGGFVLNSNGSAGGGSGLSVTTTGVLKNTFAEVAIPAGMYFLAFTGDVTAGAGSIGDLGYLALNESSAITLSNSFSGGSIAWTTTTSATGGILPTGTLGGLATEGAEDYAPLVFFAY